MLTRTPGTTATTGEPRRPKERNNPLPIFSFLKAGRTWLTHIWYHYAVAVTQQGALFAEEAPYVLRPISDARFQDVVIPKLVAAGLRPLKFRHGFEVEFDVGDDLHRLAAKIAPSQRLALIVRDPARVIESFYHHMRAAYRPRKGDHRYPETLTMSLSEVVRSERYGIGRIISYYQAFDAMRSDEHYVIHYEDMKVDAASIFRGLLLHAGHSHVDAAAVEHAVRSSAFDRLQAWERQYRTQEGLSLDRNAFRFRSASEETALTAEDLAYIQEQLRASDVGLLARYVAE